MSRDRRSAGTRHHATAAGAISGAARAYNAYNKKKVTTKKIAGASSLGAAVNRYITDLKPALEARGYEVAVFHVLGMPGSFKELFELDRDMYKLTCDELRPGTTVVAIEHRIQSLTASRGNFSRTWTLQSAEMAEAHFRTDYMEIKTSVTWVNHPWTEVPRGVPGLNGHLIGNTLIVTEGEPEVASRLPLDLVIQPH